MYWRWKRKGHFSFTDFFFWLFRLFHHRKFSHKTGRCSDESGYVSSAAFPSVSSSNFWNLLNYWCPVVSIISCSAIYPLNVPPCSPSAWLSVIGRGEWPVVPALPPHLLPISSSAWPEAPVCISCVCPVPSWVTLFFINVFSSAETSGSLCLHHVRLLASASTFWLLLCGSSRHSLLENCFCSRQRVLQFTPAQQRLIVLQPSGLR